MELCLLFVGEHRRPDGLVVRLLLGRGLFGDEPLAFLHDLFLALLLLGPLVLERFELFPELPLPFVEVFRGDRGLLLERVAT